MFQSSALPQRQRSTHFLHRLNGSPSVKAATSHVSEGTNGGDPISIRYRTVTPDRVKLFLEEEESKDSETGHVLEDVSVFVAE